MHFDPSENIRVRVRVELTDGTAQQIANQDLSRELPGILDRWGYETAERHIVDFVESQVMSGIRALVRGHIARHGRKFACEQLDRPMTTATFSKGTFDGLMDTLLKQPGVDGRRR